MVRRSIVATLVCIAVVSAVPRSAVAQSKDWTDADYAMLPKACTAKLRWHGRPDLQKPWSDKIGAENFNHLHHYCFGLWFEQKASLEFNAAKKRELLYQASGQYGYVLLHWPKDSPLRPDAQSRKQAVDLQLRGLKLK